MASGGTNPVITGSYEGTGAGITINIIGFKPKYIRFVNAGTGAEAEYSDTMADDEVRTSDSGTDAYATSGGVTLTDTGFTLGTNAVINTAGEVVHYTVWGQ